MRLLVILTDNMYNYVTIKSRNLRKYRYKSTKEKRGVKMMIFQQREYIKTTIKRKLNIIYNEIYKDAPDADKKFICKIFYKRLLKDLRNYYNIKFLNEVKGQDYISMLEYVEYFLYEYENGNMYGWGSLYDNKKAFYENIYIFPFAQ